MARTYHIFDLIIIGAGTAGLAAFKEAQKYSDNILLINDGPITTTCAQTGCMPSKALIHAAKLYDSRHSFQPTGIMGAENIRPDLTKILKKVREKRDFFLAHIHEETEKLQSSIIKGTARFDSPTTIRANGKLFHTKASIIATGSTPFIPPKYKNYAQHIITSENLFEYTTLPKNIAVIGLGAIGLEVAQTLAKLDINITAINRNKKIGVVQDPTINDKIIDTLSKDMQVWLNSDPDIEPTAKGYKLTHHSHTTTVEAFFIAAGRTPNLKKLGLKRLGIDLNGHGVPAFNRYTMQIPHYPIYIAGDVTDERAILHEAHDEGRRAAYHALNGENGYSPRYPKLQIIFTDPAISIVGDTTYALRHEQIIAGEANFATQGRAMVEDKNLGKIRIFASKQRGYLRGAEIMAPAAEHLSHFLALALTQNLTLQHILKTPFYHPTLEEGLKTALVDAQKKVITT